MITIAKTFTFDAAHFLPNMPDGHKCRGMHGHTYSVTLELRGDPDPRTGLFVDYADIAREWNEGVHNVLDHQLLNDVPLLPNPTTEALVVWIYRALAETMRKSCIAPYLHAVTVHESSTTWARYQPNP